MNDPALSLTPIGVVRTPYRSRADTPVQAALNRTAAGVIELDPRFGDATLGLDGFEHLWLVTWLADPDGVRPGEPALRQVPFLRRPDPQEFGIFATRGPRRPNPIGLSLVRLVRVDGLRIHFTGVDLTDGTSLLDLKPWVARFDLPPGLTGPMPRSGWFDEVPLPDGATPRSLAGGSDPVDGAR